MSLFERADIDPVLQGLLDALPMSVDPDVPVVSARRQLREALLASNIGGHQLVTADETFTAQAGHHVTVRVYQPPKTDGPGKPPIIVYLHGGGFALGDLDSYDAICARHAIAAAAVVISVDYRLAPEHPYPAAVNDAWYALQWSAANAERLGADPRRLVVAGDSAGGNLAAVVAQLARDNEGPDVAFQLLWYPTTTLDPTLPSFTDNANAPILNMSAVATFMHWYAGHMDLTEPPSTLAPARAALRGLPPAYIAVAGHDPLRDDGSHYATLLQQAGVPVTLHHAPALVHGYLYFADLVPAAADAVDAGLDALRKALSH